MSFFCLLWLVYSCRYQNGTDSIVPAKHSFLWLGLSEWCRGTWEVERSPPPRPQCRPWGSLYHFFHEITEAYLFCWGFLSSRGKWCQYIFYMYLWAVYLRFPSVMSLVSDSLCSFSFLLFTINASDCYVSSWPFCQSKMSTVWVYFRPGAPFPVPSWTQMAHSCHPLGESSLFAFTWLERFLLVQHRWWLPFLMTVSFWCVSVTCDRLIYLGFQSFFRGRILLFIRGVTGFKLEDCNLYFFVTRFFLCHWVLTK